MESIQPKPSLHPLVAGAAAAVILVSALAVAAFAGYLPGSRAEPGEPAKSLPAAPAANSRRTHLATACAECGVVVAVSEVNVMGKGTGMGAVAGGVAGHPIERGARRYDISVRMPDGSLRVVSTDSPPAWRPGDKVRVHRGTVRPL